ncbi:DNA adenine methylase [Spiroplasma syrphidicola EA-1]|uniref:Site-specific DNA-methyltransferase (adenine-specific) n=1 Tax=Spiroplasma syrphidicola EA-1 TaxID=1276229 RepID=R4UEE3_9MOLU|nr:Dam family site-specific DNA-(adenine-N6)-methyltransferase [Spiroplasma syrphidicola]AGM26299.1 DNA adenine methylase [Spiroplasma syrphidicola EA-1]
MKPILKWVGGKRWLMPKIEELFKEKKIIFNKNSNTYFEPFFGAGAIFFKIKPVNSVINDYNSELINLYNVIKNNVNVLIEKLTEYTNFLKENTNFYYEIRNWDREDSWDDISPEAKAARTIFLNKSCFNGLYRVNQKGQFNVPIGKNNITNILDIDNLKEVSTFFNTSNILFLNNDFEVISSLVKKGDLIYFDPPYDPIDLTSKFTEYTNQGFTKEDQIRLKKFADYLVKEKGANVIISNSSTRFIKELYSNNNEQAFSDVNYYIIDLVQANRNINSNPKRRNKIEEVLIYNVKQEK